MRASLAGLVAPLVLVLAPAHATADGVREGAADSVTLVRGGCMGPCPEYEVTIDDRGRVRWLGLDFVSRIGQTEYAASPAAGRRIVRRAARFDYDAIRRADVQRCITDMRKARVYFGDPGDEQRSLDDDHGCRSPAHRRARRLERAIDRAAKTRRFSQRGRPPCVHEDENVLYAGPDDIAVRATEVDQPYAIRRGEVLDASLGTLHANPTFRIELWSMGRPSTVQQQRLDAYAAALVEAGIARERIHTAMLPGGGGSNLGAIADNMVRIAITSGACELLRPTGKK